MHKKTLVLGFLVLVLSLIVSQPAAAGHCERCNFEFVCTIDECTLREYCDSGGALHRETCYVDQFGYCRTSGDFCRFA